MVAETDWLTPSESSVQKTTGPTFLPPGAAVTVSWPGTVTAVLTLVAGQGPWLVTVTVSVKVEPSAAMGCGLSVTDRSADGLPGGSGVTALDAAEAGPRPAVLVAATVKV